MQTMTNVHPVIETADIMHDLTRITNALEMSAATGDTGTIRNEMLRVAERWNRWAVVGEFLLNK